MKECCVCKEIKPVSDYYFHRGVTPFKRCKECHYERFKRRIPDSEKELYNGKLISKKLAAVHRKKIGNAIHTTHGMAHTKFWDIFKGMEARCKYEKHNRFQHYGGRGIKCEWVKFEDFRDDMHESYLVHVAEFGERNTQIDRIDNDGNYCKANCRWATMREQANNKSTNRLLTHGGETKTIADWARTTGVPMKTFHKRLKDGWEIEEALQNLKFRNNRQPYE